MNPRTFFIVGPTAVGKSELAADVARAVSADIVSADAFQIYRGLDLLTAKPDPTTLQKVPHHLIGTASLCEEMNAEKFCIAASGAINEIHSRHRPVIIVGGSGLYIKALTHGLAILPQADPRLREKLIAMSRDELRAELIRLDPDAARKIDIKNKRRLVRAIEICVLTEKPFSAAIAGDALSGRTTALIPATGVFLFRDREELYERINSRVEAMFQNGVIEEVRSVGAVGSTASQMIGLSEIHDLLAGQMSIQQCVAAIQQATRRYAKRQLTWFRRQTNFPSLNLSLLSHNEAVKWISLRARSAFAQRDD